MNSIIGIAGSLASGKSIAAKELSSKYNIPIFSFGKMVEQMLIGEKIEPTRENMQNRGIKIIQEIGYDGIANLLLTKYNITDNTPCIIEGIRHVDVASYYQQKFPNQFTCIFVDSDKKTRFLRIKGIEYKKLIVDTMEEFDQIDGHEIESQINEVKTKADFMIENNDSRDEFISKIISLSL